MQCALRILLAILMVGAGVMHFVAPAAYTRIVPPWVPAPLTMVYVSGVFEIFGGLGLLVPATQVWAAWGLILLLVAVFPANVHMAVHQIGFGRTPPPPLLLWGRLPLQGVLIAWAWWFARYPFR